MPVGDIVRIADVVDGGALVAWLAAYLYPVVFVGALIDASGVPFPGRLLLIAAGAMTRRGDGSAVVVIVLAAAAAMVMDHVWYFAVRRGSERLRRVLGRIARAGHGHAHQPPIERVARYGVTTIVLGRFFTSVRALGWPIVAGRGFGYAKFVWVDAAAAAAWASLWVSLGWAAGRGWQAAAETSGWWMFGIGSVVVASVLAWAILRWRRGRRLDRARG